MFKNRAILVKLDKTNKDAIEEHKDVRLIEEKTGAILSRFEKAALKVFAGVCIYVVLDTFRQVQVAKASQPHEE